MIALLEPPNGALPQGTHQRTGSVLGRSEHLKGRNSAELGFASTVYHPQMTNSSRRTIFQASHLWDTYKASGSDEGKISTFFPSHEILIGVNLFSFLSQPVKSWIAMGKILNLSLAQFLHLGNGDIRACFTG